MSLSAIADLLFPRLCVLCGQAGCESPDLCPEHEKGLQELAPTGCPRCGKPFALPLARRCEDCRRRRFAFSQAASALGYAGTGRELLLAWKLGGRRDAFWPLWRAMRDLLTHRRQADLRRWGRIEAIAFVPLHPRKRSERGFDQAEDLARELALDARLPFRRLLRRVRETPPQGQAGERAHNVEGAFEFCARSNWLARQISIPRVVLLVDDVLTSGATAAACARVLRAGGVQRVLVLTALRGGGGMVSSSPS